MNDADEIGIAALDADCGHSFEEIIDAVEKAGLAAIIHATHSHLTTESEISCSDFDKWADARGKCRMAAVHHRPGQLARAAA
jgi:methylmalonyl-CoA mutase cobalamin-binding subunit